MKRLVSPKYKSLLKFLEEVMNDPRMSARSRMNASERLTKILLQSEQVAEKRASRRDRVKIALAELAADSPPPQDKIVKDVLDAVVGGSK